MKKLCLSIALVLYFGIAFSQTAIKKQTNSIPDVELKIGGGISKFYVDRIDYFTVSGATKIRNKLFGIEYTTGICKSKQLPVGFSSGLLGGIPKDVHTYFALYYAQPVAIIKTHKISSLLNLGASYNIYDEKSFTKRVLDSNTWFDLGPSHNTQSNQTISLGAYCKLSNSLILSKHFDLSLSVFTNLANKNSAIGADLTFAFVIR